MSGENPLTQVQVYVRLSVSQSFVTDVPFIPADAHTNGQVVISPRHHCDLTLEETEAGSKEPDCARTGDKSIISGKKAGQYIERKWQDI